MRYGLTVRGKATKDGIECLYRGRTAKVRVSSAGAYLIWNENGETKIAMNVKMFKLMCDLEDVKVRIKEAEGDLKKFYESAQQGIEYRLGVRQWV